MTGTTMTEPTAAAMTGTTMTELTAEVVTEKMTTTNPAIAEIDYSETPLAKATLGESNVKNKATRMQPKDKMD